MREMKVNNNGIKLNVRDYEDNGEVIIFLHYGSGNLMAWDAMIPYFKNMYRVITMDLRGHGRSDKPLKGYSLEEMSADIIAVMDNLKIDRVHIIGSSLGGEVAAALAANYADRIISIVVEGAPQNYFGENGVYDISEGEIEEKKEELRKKRESRPVLIFKSRDELTEAIKKQFQSYGWQWNDIVENYVDYDITETDAGEYTTGCPKYVIDDYIEYYWDIKFEDYYKKVQCPVLFVPDENELKSQAINNTLEKLQDLLLFSRIAKIKGAKHAAVSFELPKKFSKAILDFYREINVYFNL